jgi:hypothetical protein
MFSVQISLCPVPFGFHESEKINIFIFFKKAIAVCMDRAFSLVGLCQPVFVKDHEVILNSQLSPIVKWSQNTLA